MPDMVSFVKRAAERTGFRRDVFKESKIPTASSNIIVLPFFGDIDATFVLSSLLLKRYHELRGKKYLILASWPGFHHLFPYVDEYWTVRDPSALKSLANSVNNSYNTSEFFTTYKRNLVEHFENVQSYDDIRPYYENGITQKFWEVFKEVKRFLPEVPSSNSLSESFRTELSRRTGRKVVVFPVEYLRSWQKGRTARLKIDKEFWVKLLERLLAEGLIPVVYQNCFTYDLSVRFAERCMYLAQEDVAQTLAAMRAVGCVLDIHSGVSRLAIAARCPFLAADERMRFDAEKAYEVDDLCCGTTPRQYLFHFSTLLMSGTPTDWDNSLINNIIARLEKFFPSLDRDSWMPTGESYEPVSYDVVRKRKMGKFGVRFIKKH